MILIGECPVVVKPLLVPLELVPGDVTGMMPGDEERPVLGTDSASSAIFRLFARQAHQASLGAAIDIGVLADLGVMQDVQDAAIAQRSPNDLTVPATTPEPRGALEVMVGEVFDDGQGRRRLVEQVELSRTACWTVRPDRRRSGALYRRPVP